MSSSESEEFFDALDSTPSKGRLSNVTHNDETTEGDHAFSGEEKTLLETKKLVEIRRKLEDEALDKRLQAIHETKEKEKEEKLKQEKLEKDADVNVKRRRKLEEMRQMMYAENTPDKPVKKTSEKKQTFTSESTSVSDLSKQACSNICQTEVMGAEIKDNLHNSQLEQNSSGNLHPKMYVSSHSDGMEQTNPQASSDNTRKGAVVDDFNSSHINKEYVSQHSNIESDDVNIVKSVGAVTEHLSQIDLSDIKAPDLIQSVKSSSLGRNKSPVTVFIESSEDDVVKAACMPSGSTECDELNLESEVKKGESPADKDSKDMPPPPLVPPRRKKKVVSVGTLQDASNTSHDAPESEIIKPKRPTTSPPNQLAVPTTSGCLLTAPSPQVARKTLNLNEAAMGNKLVTAAEEEHTRAVNDVKLAGGDTESIWDNESMADSQGTSTIDSPQSTISNEDKVVMKENKSHSFPRGQQRPVSDISLTPTQMAILDDISVVNIDTGERIPISLAEEKIPQCINPLSLHIMRRTKEYLSDSSLNNQLAQAEGEGPKEELEEDGRSKTVTTLGKKKKKLKSLFGKAKNKLKSVKDEVFHNAESNSSSEDEDGERKMIQVKASKTNKGTLDFDLIVPVQYMEGAHNGAVWTMKFSHCGRLLATGGTDNLLKVWVLKDAYSFFDDMRVKYSEEQKKRMSPAVSEDSTDDSSGDTSEHEGSFQSPDEDWFCPFNSKPFCTYKGHTADILDVSWSKNYFILTSSMDKTVRLWHVSRKECLCCFQHIDFVTAIAFHPKDDRYFLSGSLDGKLRLWNIPDRKVELWNEVNGSTKLITATNFCMKGKFAVAGTYDGRCVFYSTEQLKYYTQIHVRSTRGKNSKGRKITGVEPMPGEDKILVTSNDSRIRIYDLRDLTLTCKYKGCVNNSSQIKAHFSHDGRFVVCGSEDHFVYIWRTQHEFHKFSSARRDRSDYWESIKAHTAVVTVALFAPKPNLVIKNQFEYLDSEDKQSTPEVRGEVLISADYNGTIKCFINKFKPVNT